MTNGNTVRVLKLDLHGITVAYLAGYRGGGNVLTFTPEFRGASNRPTFSLITNPAFPKAGALMSEPWVKRQKLHPVLSNLLPEGALRDFLAQGFKVHGDNEFELLAWLGQDLPGALIATTTDAIDHTQARTTQ